MMLINSVHQSYFGLHFFFENLGGDHLVNLLLICLILLDTKDSKERLLDEGLHNVGSMWGFGIARIYDQPVCTWGTSEGWINRSIWVFCGLL